MRKTGIIFIVGVLTIMWGAVKFSYAAEGDMLTNAKFAEMLAKKINAQLPAGAENLSAQDYFNALANALAAKGINNFVNANPNDTVTAGNMADVLYIAVGGKESLDTNGKIQYLAGKGIMAAATDLAAAVTISELQAVIDNPAFSALAAEGYTPPAGEGYTPPPPAPAAGGIGAGGIMPDLAPEVVTENPASGS